MAGRIADAGAAWADAMKSGGPVAIYTKPALSESSKATAVQQLYCHLENTIAQHGYSTKGWTSAHALLTAQAWYCRH